mmetsp:Transcript_48724/g.76081  ORF Transcript_48724/g.76081 Transcript_48724/m.76081 type:complete len:287 (+) Transcript_48724:456-1316(+)
MNTFSRLTLLLVLVIAGPSAQTTESSLKLARQPRSRSLGFVVSEVQLRDFSPILSAIGPDSKPQAPHAPTSGQLASSPESRPIGAGFDALSHLDAQGAAQGTAPSADAGSSKGLPLGLNHLGLKVGELFGLRPTQSSMVEGPQTSALGPDALPPLNSSVLSASQAPQLSGVTTASLQALRLRGWGTGPETDGAQPASLSEYCGTEGDEWGRETVGGRGWSVNRIRGGGPDEEPDQPTADFNAPDPYLTDGTERHDINPWPEQEGDSEEDRQMAHGMKDALRMGRDK